MTISDYLIQVERHAKRYKFGRSRMADIKAIAVYREFVVPLRRIHDPVLGRRWAESKVHYIMNWLESIQR